MFYSYIIIAQNALSKKKINVIIFLSIFINAFIVEDILKYVPICMKALILDKSVLTWSYHFNKAFITYYSYPRFSGHVMRYTGYNILVSHIKICIGFVTKNIQHILRDLNFMPT